MSEPRTYRIIDTRIVDADGTTRNSGMAVEIPTSIRVDGTEYRLGKGKQIVYVEVRKWTGIVINVETVVI